MNEEKFEKFKKIAYESDYGLNIINITDYISIYGMFELNSGSKYEVFDNKNIDQYTWNKYNNSIRLNDHDLIEIVIDLKDVTLLGTKNYQKKIDEVSNRIQIRTNIDKVNYDSYKWCKYYNTTCSLSI